MIHPPPSSTLFPYTTLFRSRLEEAAADESEPGVIEVVAVELVDGHAHPAGGHELVEHLVLEEEVHARRRDGHDHRDRKSTRLNSSHQIISYAVFCLKKKKIR